MSQPNHLQPSPISNFLIPRLVITQQTSLAQDTVVKNGISNLIYVVVKQSQFTINLGLDTTKLIDGNTLLETSATEGKSILNFNHMTIEAKLLYDADDEKLMEREVVFVKSKPMEYKVRTNETGTQASVDCRLQVLTSQMEDMLFRIKFRGLDMTNSTEISPLLSVRTHPIKVISKPEQSRKKKPIKKRTLNDMLFETLDLIEKRQKKQFDLLNKLSSDLPPLLTNNPTPPSSSSTSSSSIVNSTNPFYDDDSQKRKKQKIDNDSPLDFEDAFRDLMDAFNMLKNDKKIERMKDFLISSGTSNDYLSELHDLFSSEGLEKEIGRVFHSTPHHSDEYSECLCENCPHKIELERIEEFYKEIFSLP